MKKKITFIASMLMLTGSMFYFSGCKKTVETLTDTTCYICTKTDLPDAEVCDTDVLDLSGPLRLEGYTCTLK